MSRLKHFGLSLLQGAGLALAVRLGQNDYVWTGLGVACCASMTTYVEGCFTGYCKGYEYARSLVGAEKLPAYDKLHEELP